jgi:hypothetical protein
MTTSLAQCGRRTSGLARSLLSGCSVANCVRISSIPMQFGCDFSEATKLNFSQLHGGAVTFQTCTKFISVKSYTISRATA